MQEGIEKRTREVIDLIHTNKTQRSEWLSQVNIGEPMGMNIDWKKVRFGDFEWQTLELST